MAITSLNNFGIPTTNTAGSTQVLLMPKLKYRFRVTLLGFGVAAATELTKQVQDITRAEIKGAVESLLLELVGLRAIYDFAVQCDENNNTPARVDRNELWVDIAIEPVKAIEFIYIPLRVKNTGEI